MHSVDLDEEFLQLFFNITDQDVPEKVDLVMLKKQLISIVEVMKNLNENAKTPYRSRGLGNLLTEDEESSKPSILVVDDLGVITYQLKILLSQFELDIDCSQEIYDAVNKYKKHKYKYVVMDLFIPTEREGFILLTELKKLAIMNNTETIVGVITASPRKDIENQCKARGADFFLEKNSDWQNRLLAVMDSYINQKDDAKEDEPV